MGSNLNVLILCLLLGSAQGCSANRAEINSGTTENIAMSIAGICAHFAKQIEYSGNGDFVSNFKECTDYAIFKLREQSQNVTK